MTFSPSPFLRRALLADAAISGGTGLLMAGAAGLVDGLLGLPTALLREAGLLLLPFAALVGWLATRERPPLAAIRAVIGANALWVLGSLLLLVSGWVAPTVLGYAFVIAQAIVVAVFAELQYMGLRRTDPAMA